MNILTRNLPMLLIGLVLGALLSLGQGVLAEKESALPLEDLRTFTEIFDKIKHDYVEPIEDKALLENAIRGMLSGLDPPFRLPGSGRLPRTAGGHQRRVRWIGNRSRHGRRLRESHRPHR